MPKRKVRPATGLLIAGLSMTLFFGTLEAIGYWWEQSTAQSPLGWTLIASRRMDLQIDGSPERSFHRFQPETQYLWSGVPVKINSKGFRTEEFRIPKPENCYRILNIGDSVAFGWGVEQKDTYGKIVESLLRQQTPGSCIEVINAGVPGWTLEDERNFLTEEGLEYEPDLVLLDITLVNDIYGQRFQSRQQSSIFNWLRDKTYSWPFFTTQVRFLMAKSWGPEAIPVLNPPRDASAYFPLDDESPLWKKTWTLVQEMNRLSRINNVEFMVIVFPTALQLNDASHPNLPQKIFGEFARQDEIRLIDPLPVFKEACEMGGPGACDGYRNLLFQDVWMHPSPLGHRLVSELVLERLNGNV